MITDGAEERWVETAFAYDNESPDEIMQGSGGNVMSDFGTPRFRTRE